MSATVLRSFAVVSRLLDCADRRFSRGMPWQHIGILCRNDGRSIPLELGAHYLEWAD
jgi:hypothetical protein